MAYNNYGYTGYNAYYQQPQTQDQNHAQSPAGHTQAGYPNSSNPYSQYNQYNNPNQYATHQSSDTRTHQQYQTKSSIDNNSSFQSSYGYPQQQYATATTRNDTTAGYPGYAPATQTSNAGYAYNTTQNALEQNSKGFGENTALSGLAYVSQLGRNPTTLNPSTSDGQIYPQSAQQSQQQTQTRQNQQSASILPNPTHQQAYGQASAQSKQATPSIPQQPLYRPNVNNQQRPQPSSATIRRSPSLPVKQNSISQQSSTKTMSPHASIMGNMVTNSSRSNAQSSNAHQLTTIMNQNQDSTTSKVNQQQPQSQGLHGHHTNPISFESRSPANMVQSPAVTEIQQPTTIDPNAIFNHTEWAQKRRPPIEDQEVAKRMKENKAPPAPIQPLAPPSSVVQPAQTMVQPSQTMIQPIPPPLSTPRISTPDQSRSNKSAPDDEIRSEMKAFAEKLRLWKSRDGSGTVEDMWRQALQGTNNAALLGTRISSTPQLSRSSIHGGLNRLDTSGAFDDDPSLGSPFQTIFTEEMPDLGKFPAMRRRTRADKGVSRSAKAGQVAAARAITQTTSPATILPNFGSGTPGGVGADAGAESMRRAMQAFHQTPTPATPEATTSATTTTAKPKQHNTLWPEEQKPQLALATKGFLEMQPANEGKTIDPSIILQMLNQNPSYDNLCIMLANSGFSVPRAAFAQELLNIVPQNSNKQAPTTTNPAIPEETPAKKPRGRPKKNSLAVTPQQETPNTQPVNGGTVSWGANLTQGNMNNSGGSIDLTNGDGEYGAFYEKMRLISGPSPSQTNTPIQQPGKKRNAMDMNKAGDMNGGPPGKKQHIDRQGSNKGHQNPNKR